MLTLGIPKMVVSAIKALYKDSWTWVRVCEELTPCCTIKTGVKQGFIISPCLFKIVLGWVLLKATRASNGIPVSDSLQIPDLSFEDDLAYMRESEADL